MKALVFFFSLLLPLLSHAQTAQKTNFFISPGSQADQIASGNHTSDYPIYQQHDATLLSWKTNWTIISLLLYQNENASYIRLLDFVENPPNSLSFDMSPDVDLTWNDVFFLTLWNENWVNDGGQKFFSSSYFRINASSTTTSTPSPSPTSSTSTSSTNTATQTSIPQVSPTDASESSGLSSGTKVGLGVGLGLGVPLLALAGVAVFFYRRRAAAAGSASPPPPPGGPSGGGGYSGGGGDGQMPYYQHQRVPPPGVDLANPSPFKLGGYDQGSVHAPPSPAMMPVEAANYPVQELAGDIRR